MQTSRLQNTVRLATRWIAATWVTAALASVAGALPQVTGGVGGIGDHPVRPVTVGGEYRGPGDTVPGSPSAPSGGPTTGGPAPSTPGAVGGPAAGGPSAGGPGAPAPAPPPGFPGSPTEPVEPESPGARPRVQSETAWQLWWHYNRWEYVDPRGAQQNLATTGSDNFYTGRSSHQAPTLKRPTRYQMQTQVLPALVAEFSKGGQADSQIALAHALAKLRMAPGEEQRSLPSFLAAMKPSLKGSSALLTEKVLLFLGLYGVATGPESAFVPLAMVLQNDPSAKGFTGKAKSPWRWRAFAAYGLGHLGERNIEDPVLVTRVFNTLLNAYPNETNTEVRIAIGLAAARLGVPVESQKTASKGKAIQRSVQVQRLLQLYCTEEDERVRAQLATGVGTIAAGCHSRLRGLVIEELLKPLDKRKRAPAHLQFGCVNGLAQIVHAGLGEWDVAARKELMRVGFKSGTPRASRFLARVALAQSFTRKGVGKDADERWAGIDDARRLFVRSLGRERGESLGWLALALGILERGAYERGGAPDSQAIRALRAALGKERSPDAAPALGLALGLAQDKESIPLLAERLRDTKNETMRGYFGLSLGLAGAVAERQHLLETLLTTRNQPFALENLSIALALLGDGSAARPLFTMLEEVSDPEVQASVASAIGWSRDPELLHDLIQSLGDSRISDRRRGWTAVAIGRIVDGDQWPWTGRWSQHTNYLGQVATRIEPDYRTGLLDLW